MLWRRGAGTGVAEAGRGVDVVDAATTAVVRAPTCSIRPARRVSVAPWDGARMAATSGSTPMVATAGVGSS